MNTFELIWIDLMICFMLAISALDGYKKGITRILFSIARFIVSFFGAKLLGPTVGDMIDVPREFSDIVGFISVFAAIFVIASIGIFVLRDVKIPGLEKIDKILGMICGVLFTFFVIFVFVGAVVNIIVLFATAEELMEFDTAYKGSILLRTLININLFLFH